MRNVTVTALIIAVAAFASLVGASPGAAQSYALPKGSSLAATPPIDQRGRQFRALSRAQKRIYVKQGYRGPGWRAYR